MDRQLIEAFAAWGQQDLVYGQTDCCQFAAFIAHELSGQWLLPWEYTGESEAMALVALYGDLRGAMIEALGSPTQTPKSGDIALWELPAMEKAPIVGAGIFTGHSVAILGRSNTLMEIKPRFMKEAWTYARRSSCSIQDRRNGGLIHIDS